jgi:hypothetical protein
MNANRAHLIFAILSAAVFLTASCSKGERADALEKQLKNKIRYGVSIGAGRSEVESFVDSLDIGSRKFTRSGYRNDVSSSHLAYRAKQEAPDSKKTIPSEIKGFFAASMRKVDSDYRYLFTIDMALEFYFDENERLVDYVVYQIRHP